MRVIVTAVLCALMLSGCAINWPTEMSAPRFTWSDNASGPAADPATQERQLRKPASIARQAP